MAELKFGPTYNYTNRTVTSLRASAVPITCASVGTYVGPNFSSARCRAEPDLKLGPTYYNSVSALGDDASDDVGGYV